MADTIDIDEFSTQPLEAIAKHLRKGSFCEIYERSNEKDTLGALKFMCIVDYSLQRWDNLYRRIEEVANPKLLTQLMQFHTYGSFKYYFYRVDDGIGKRVLQCKSCELIGPYALILSHMAIVHNQHVGLRKCAYCDRIDFKDHIEDDTLQQCYRNYLQRYGIAWDEKICGIMNDIHDLLKGMADKFKVTTRRDCAFRGIGYKTDEWLADGYDSELDENIQVFANRTPQIKAKNMSGRSRVLNNEFKRIIGKLYGGNNTVSRTPRQQSAATNLNGNDTIDDYDNGLLASDAAYDDHNSHSDSTQSQASSVNDNPNSASSNANGNDTMDDYDAANDDHYTSNDSTQSQSSSHNDNQRSVSFAPMAIARGDDENDNGPIQSGPSTVNVSSTPHLGDDVASAEHNNSADPVSPHTPAPRYKYRSFSLHSNYSSIRFGNNAAAHDSQCSPPPFKSPKLSAAGPSAETGNTNENALHTIDQQLSDFPENERQNILIEMQIMVLRAKQKALQRVSNFSKFKKF